MNQPDPDRSCFTCPSLLTADQAATFFDKSVGTPMCARFGKPIGTVNTSESQAGKIAKAVAKNCSMYGEARPSKVNWSDVNLTVTFPDPETIGAPRMNQALVNSCMGCANFISPSVVTRELGWTAGMCAAKGKLLLANRYTYEARDCEQRSFGQVRNSVHNLVMLPEYDATFQGTNDPTKAHQRNLRNFVDPTEYETDKPVSDEDAKHGIRAWRAITDHDTGNTVHLPIYRIDFFPPEEQAKIPRTGDNEHPEDYADHGMLTYKVAVLWTELDETPGMWGQPGTGKTEFFRYMAWLMCLPFERFSITASSELDDLAGQMTFVDNETTFVPGRFARAWQRPCVIVVDEYNLGRPDVQQYLRPCIDNSKQLVLDQAPGAPRLDRHLDCYLGVAMNPAWDMRNVGAHQIGNADADRLMHLYVEMPPPELERMILAKACEHDGYTIPVEKLTTIMQIADDIRELCDNGTLMISWALRPQIKVARLTKWFDTVTAYRMASADYLEPEAQQVLLTAVRAHVENN